MTGSLFKGWQRKTGCVLLAVSLIAICARIRIALQQRDHDILGPLCIFLAMMVILAPIIGGVTGAMVAEAKERTKWVSIGIACGTAVSAACYLGTMHLVIEYLAG